MSGDSNAIKVGILTVSDSCFHGQANDKSGENLKKLIDESQIISALVKVKEIVPDEVDLIKDKLIEWCYSGLNLILTTGGTGFSPRDVTPEATRAVIEKEAPGLTLAMLKGSLDITPFAMLSRPVCGIRKRTLIINLPGSTKAAQECLEFVMPALPHALDLLQDDHASVKATHKIVQSEGVKKGRHEQHQHDKQEEGHHHHHHHHHHESHHHHSHSDKSGVDASHVARRHRISPYPMISVQEAIDTVMAELHLSGTELLHYNECLGMVLAEDVFAKDPLPPFPASIKDGYAVIAADGAGLRTVLGDSTAGDMPEKTLISGYCIRISTGAAVPPGADAVIQVEDTELVKASDDGCTELEIKLLTEPKVGQDIRPVGSDIEQGEKILSTGQRLGPSELGLLATVGVTKVRCYKLPAVGILSTGNELMEPGEDLKPGKIRDSNRITLLALLREQRFHPQDIGIAKDTPQELLKQIKQALDHVDVLVTSGGVSMGEKDLLRDVLVTDLNATVHFARVFMKPGKPTTFATLDYNGVKKFVFGLPGNPVSATVTCHLYIVPALKKMAGEVQPERTKIKAKLTTNMRLDPRPEYHRCCLYWPPEEAVPEAVSTGSQMSSRLLSMRAANALLVLPPRTDELQELHKGELVDALIIAPL